MGILKLPIADLQAAGVPWELAEAWYRLFRDRRREAWIKREWDQVEAAGCGIATELDPEYPEGLNELLDRPPVLYYKGSWPPAGTRGLGVVGTRHPTAYGRSVAERLATDLCVQGLAVISGLAQGIDACAHQAALKAGGTTLAVLGCGLGHVFPQQNAELYAEIAKKGIIISEFPYDTPPDARHFPRRNRIISGISQGVVVIEAAERSGAAITARYAAEQGRDVFAVPGSIFQPMSKGCHRLIKQGAKLVESAEDILEELKIPIQTAAVLSGEPEKDNAVAPEILAGLSECERRIYDLLAAEPMAVDEIAQLVVNRFEEIAGSLLALELKGMIRMLPGQRYAKN